MLERARGAVGAAVGTATEASARLQLQLRRRRRGLGEEGEAGAEAVAGAGGAVVAMAGAVYADADAYSEAVLDVLGPWALFLETAFCATVLLLPITVVHIALLRSWKRLRPLTRRVLVLFWL